MKFELKTAVNRLEDAIITISGPALAISGIIAGVPGRCRRVVCLDSDAEHYRARERRRDLH